MHCQDNYARIGNVNTRYWVCGEGPQLVLLHGLGTSIDIFKDNMLALSQSCKVYAPDLVGFGLSDKPKANYSTSFLVEFFKDFLDHFNIKKTSLLGASMGGALALKFAIEYPARVEKLILEDSAGLGRDLVLGLRLSSIPALSKLSLLKFRWINALYMKTLVYNPDVITHELIDLYHKIFSLPGAMEAFSSVLINAVNIRGVQKEIVEGITEKLSSLRCPTLILWGEQDGSLPVKDAYRAHQEIPGSELCIFDKCGHFPNMEKTPEFNDAVLRFMKK